MNELKKRGSMTWNQEMITYRRAQIGDEAVILKKEI
jgi:hypothetical protein